MEIPPAKNNNCVPSKENKPKSIIMLGAEGTKTPTTLAILLAPKL